MIPTAEEFFKQHSHESTPGYEVMIEFTKLHVEAALKAARDKVVDEFDYWDGDTNKILLAYPSNNIK